MSARRHARSSGRTKRTVKRRVQSGTATASSVTRSVCRPSLYSTGWPPSSPHANPLPHLNSLDYDGVLALKACTICVTQPAGDGGPLLLGSPVPNQRLQM